MHLLIKTEAKQYTVAKVEFQDFMRRFAGAIAFKITGAKKGQGLERNTNGRSFWEKLAFSRIVEWGRQYKKVHDYFTKNFFESQGLWFGKHDAWTSPWLSSLVEAGVGPP